MSEIAISVVVPVFNSAQTLRTLVRRIDTVIGHTSYEILLIDDCSTDTSWNIIGELARQSQVVKGFRLARNYGQHAALLAGVRQASAPLIVTMDDDLQNPPESIPALLAALTPERDVVYGTPISARHSWVRSTTGRFARWWLRLALGVEYAQYTSPFRVFRTKLRNGFAGDVGPDISLDALLGWTSTRFASVTVEHHKRVSGRSNYNTWKLVKFMISSITGYSTAPLRLATGLGLATIVVSLAVLIYVIGRPLMSGDSVPGFPFLASTIAIFSGTQLFILGILGQYIGRMHFRVMNKPTYTIADRTDVMK